MIDRRTLLLSLGATAFATHATLTHGQAKAVPRWPMPPQHRREPLVVGKFGHRRNDDYSWMRPQDWHAVLRDPASLDGGIKAAVIAENDYIAAMMRPSAQLQSELIARMTTIEASTPEPLTVQDGGFVYYEREIPGGDHSVYARRPVTGGTEQVLLDVDAEARGKAFYSLHWHGPQRSLDGKLFGWAADETGSGIFTIHARDMSTGREAFQPVSGSHGEFAFSPDSRYLFWVGRDDKGRPAKIVRREIAGGAEESIYEEADSSSFYLNLKVTASGRYLVIRIMNGAMAEVRLLPMATPTAKPVLMEPRVAGLTYDVDDWNGQLVVLTDVDGAADFKLMTADIDAPSRSNWRELVPHVAGRFISAIHPFANQLVREERRDANPRLVIMDRQGGEKEIAFDEAAYALTVPPGQSWQAPELTFAYQSPRTPSSTYRLDLAKGTFKAVSQKQFSRGYDPSRYELKRLFARAADGAEVPITLLTRKGLPLDGKAPLFLYGYGSYGATVEAEFSPAAVALVEQGWSYAIAHVRGGAERGTNWWRSVLKHGKKTTFTDFIACAEHLISQRYTSAKRIVAHGLSAGGLLMGAIYTMRPDLWAGVIAQVPFVDVLNTMDDFETHPLGTTALPIWGDPRVPEDYAYVSSYSPYDNLKPAAYPALLATGGIADDRVAFWEPLKFATKARLLTTAANPIMVKTALSGGHMGESGAKARREQSALFLSFAIWAADRRWGDVPQRPG